MIHNFVYDSSPEYKRIQLFEYLDKDLDEYSFEYTRDILSDLSKFNAPIFAQRERRGIVFNKDISLKKDRLSFTVFDTDKPALRTGIRKPLIDKALINSNIFTHRVPSTADVFRILFGTKYFDTNIFQGFVGVKTDIKKSYIADMYSGYKYIYGNIMEFYAAKQPDYILNVYETISAIRPIFILNVYDQILGIQPIKNLNVYNVYNAQKIPGYMDVNVFQNYFGNKDNYLKQYPDGYLTIKKPEKYFMTCFNTIIAERDLFSLNEFENILVTRIEAVEIKTNIYKTILGVSTDKKVNVNKTLSIKEIPEILNGNVFKIINTINNNSVRKTYKFDILNIHRKLSNKRIVMSTGLKSFKKNLNKRFITNTKWFGRKNRKIMQLNKEQYFDSKNAKPNYYNTKIQWGWKNNKIFNVNNTESFSFKGQKRLVIETYNNWLIKNKKLLVARNDNSFLWKDRYSFVIFGQPYFVYKDRKPLKIENTETHVFKDRKDFRIENTESHIFKDGHSFIIQDTDVYLKKKRKGFRIEDHGHNIHKEPKSFVIEDSGISLEKLAYSARQESMTGIIALPYDLMLDNNSIGFVLNKHDVQTLEELTRTNKALKELFVNSTNLSLIKNTISTTLNNTDLWIFKEPKNVWVETHAVMLTSLVKDIIFQRDELFLEKNKKNSIINLATSVYKKERLLHTFNENLFIYKKQKHLFLDKEMSVSKLHKSIYLSNGLFTYKTVKEAFITNGINLLKGVNFAIFNTDFGMSKEVLELYVNEENIWCSKAKRGDIFKQYFVEKSPKEIMYENNKIQLNNGIFVDRFTYESNIIVQEFQRMQRLVKELEKPVTHTYNWAWVYEPDNPLEDTEEYKGLDELLLPEKDIDYSTFEEYIFNKDKMRPTNPIEIIDDTTFIAKYPIKHPTPNYEEIGIVYVDVPSELMYRIFCKYYEIWYANIFKFGNMSMVDSLRMMLDFMYSWIILEYTGTEYLEPALRVFRQIRWFGEKSVMHNAKYLISYERTNLICDLHKGSLTEIENDIEENNLFYINSTLGVIMNNSTYFNQKAYINLCINYPVETILKFNLSQAGGTTQVYLDSIFVDNITNASKTVVVTIPPGKHTVKIVRPANDNYATCYIGGIVIANGSYTNLQITYDPDLKLGNLPLNDVAKKMIDLASLYDNEQEAFENYRKGNLAVGELYKELQRYWELHHQGKIKGKRLTIKET